LLALWSRQLDNGSDFKVQGYWSYNERDENTLFSPTSDIYDVEFQYHFSEVTGSAQHEIVWGASHRYAEDEVDRGFFSIYIPAQKDLSWQTLFVQDEISLSETVRVTPGIKMEWNDYTDREHLPSLRVAWDVADNHLLWGSWSRAVRAPSRFDREIFFPEQPPFVLAGGPNFDSEVAHVYELGLRAQPSATVNYSVTLFRYEWDKLRSSSAAPFPLYVVNGIEGSSWGVEAWSTWQVSDTWRLFVGLNTIEKNLELKEGATGLVAGINSSSLHNDPSYQWMIRSSHDFGANMQMDVNLRRVDALKNQPVPAYTELDLHLGWQVVENFELSVTGTNLLHGRHAEFASFTDRNVISRSILFGFRWTL
jgi:iron complex outermembrane receptor protein